MKWIKIEKPCPVLNTPDFSAVFSGSHLPLNDKGHPYPFEFVALPGMRFKPFREISASIVQIEWAEYGVNPLYIDRRFASICSNGPEKKELALCSSELLEQMETRVGTSYVWGGNWASGIPEMLSFYPPSKKLDPRTEELWTFRGLDCSGLLFEASGGLTPRNTSHLLNYGKSLERDELLPLDMILYPGHVLFVRDSATIIESKAPFGVRICSLAKRLSEIEGERRYVRDWSAVVDPQAYFTIRRFAS